MWSNNYIGIPYKANGRDISGLDCWGLARLIYSEQFQIELPSFSTDYHIDDNDRIKELIAQYSEGWQAKESPEEGDIVLFRILGENTHIGVCVSNTHFIHVREGMDVAVESFDNPKWNRRVSGYFKYNSAGGIVMNAVPHPLKTERVTVLIQPGTTLEKVYELVIDKYKIAPELCDRIHILVNGIPIHRDVWSSYTLQETDVVEYRAVAGKSAARMILTLVVAYIAFQIAGPIGAEAGIQAVAAGANMATANAVAQAVTAIAYATITVAGMYLINAILPIRPPGEPANPGSTERQLMIEGGRNSFNPYGAIPVVLGKVRLTPPQGARTYVEYGTPGTSGVATRDSYLKMLLVWGYGPLYIDSNTLRVGDTPLASYDITNNGGSLVTLDRITEPTSTQLAEFDALYSEDVSQIYIGSELTYQGQATTAEDIVYDETTTTNEQGVITTYEYGRLSTTYTIDAEVGWTSRVITKTTQGGVDYGADRVTVSLHFPTGHRRIETTGGDAGKTLPLYTEYGVRIRYSTGVNTWTAWTYQSNITVSAAEKDAVTYNATYNLTDKTKTFEIAVRRITPDLEEQGTARNYSKAFLQTITAYRPNLKPCIDPPKPVGTKLAKTALKIKANDNLNGQIEGVNAVVQTYCRVWNGTDWNTKAATSNPAALFLYVLTHPGNPQRVESADESSKINFAQLQYWYNYCQNYQINSTTVPLQYNGVLGQQRGVLDVLRDICAAGRGSPALIDGKWSVIIDEPRSTIVQHFTPHNSWGFESTKLLPRFPDALKVTFYDENNDYQEKEIIVPAAGYTENTAELFETISLPGVTNETLAEDFARWHYAQIKLRPEIYTLNTDIEYLVCNRGDRVKVTHDVPMWGSGSGRIKNRLSSTQFELDEELYIDITKSYTLRVRSSSGASVTRTLSLPGATGYYKTISVTSSTTSTEVDAGDLFMFGEVSKESQDLVVISIEPTSGEKNARITLVDYGVTDTYNIFTGYRNLTGTVYSPNITVAPENLVNSLGSLVPSITVSQIDSDESTMELISPGVFRYNIRVPFTNPLNLPVTIEAVEGQIDRNFTADASSSAVRETALLSSGGITFKDVEEGKTYKFRLRYITSDGRTGLWTSWQTHTVIGKNSPPSLVTGLTSIATETAIDIKWTSCPDVDYAKTVLRYALITGGTPNPTWAQGTALAEVTGNGWTWTDPATANYRIFAKHYDVAGNESVTASQTDRNWTSTTVSSINVELSNIGLVNSNEDGSSPVLTNSGTTISVKQGTTSLRYDAVGTANGRWTITSKTDGSGITSGTLVAVQDATNGDLVATVNNLTGFTADTGTITYTISGKTTTGKSFSVTKEHRYTKVKQGATGPASTVPGPTGPTGQSNHRVYIAAAYNSTPATPGSTTSGATPSGWSATPVTITTGQAQWQSDGVTPAGSTTTTWNTPYQSYLKVDTLDAVTANTGNLLVTGTLTMGTTGVIRSSGNTYGGNGIFLGYDSTAYKFSVGTGTNKLTFDGTTLSVPASTVTGQLTSSQLNVGVGGGNLLRNSGFEVSGGTGGTSSLTVAGNWTVFNGGSGDSGRVLSTSLDAGMTGIVGSLCQFVQIVTATTGADTGIQAIGALPVIAGQNYIGSAYVNPNVGGKVAVLLRFLDASSNSLGDYYSQYATANTWSRLSVSVVAPANAVSVQFMVRGITATSESFRVDGAQLEQATLISAYAPRPAEVLDGSITNSQIADVAATKVTGTLTNSQIADVAATKVTGQLTASQLAVSIGGGNLVKNSSFEADINSDGVPDNWTTYTNGQVGSGGWALTGNAVHGTYALRLTATALGTSTVDRVGVWQDIPVSNMAGQKFRVSASLLGVTGNPQVQLYIDYITSVGAYISSGSGFAVTPGGSWVRSSTPIETVPANAFMARVYFLMQARPGGPAAAEIRLDAVQFEFGELVTAYAPKPDEILANTITVTEVADNAITTPKLIAGAVVTGKIAAKAITADKLVISGGSGSSLWTDTCFQDTSAWAVANWGVLPTQTTLTDGIAGGTSMRSPTGGSASAYGLKRVPVTIGKTYRLSVYARRSSDSNGYLYYRINGSNVESSSYTEQVYSIEGVQPGTSWTRYTATVVANQQFWSPMILINHAASAGWMEAQDIRIEEVIPGELIVDGAITANKVSAGAITTDKLVITGKGEALNEDPNTQDVTAWTDEVNRVSLSIATDTTAPNGNSVLLCSQARTVLSQKLIPLDPNKNYQYRIWTRQATGSTTSYITVAFYDGSGNVISGGATGWPNQGTYHYFGLLNGTLPSSWTEYRISFGPNESATIPAGAKFCRIGVLSNYTGTGSQYITGVRLMLKSDSDLIVDGAITANKINVGNLSAVNSSTGSLLVTGTLTMGTSGVIKSSGTNYGGDGIFLGYDNTAYKFSVGTGTSKITFDGTTLSIPAANITGTLVASQINVGSLNALSANTGSLSVTGTLTMGTSGVIKSTNTNYGGDGIFLGYDSTAYKFSVGSGTNKITFDGTTLNIPAANITGVLSADRIATGSITTTKLLVTGKGSALNDDPALMDSSAWPTNNGFSFVTITDGVSGTTAIRSSSSTSDIYSRGFALNASKTYRIRCKVNPRTGNGGMYLVVGLRDSSGNTISRDGTHWYYPVAGTAPTSGWNEYTGVFGAGQGGNAFPSNARTMYVGLYLNYSGTTGYMEAQDLRIEEMAGTDLIVDGAITANKINVGNLSAVTANTGSLSVTGTLTMGTSGVIKSTNTNYGGDGVFLGYDSTAYKFSVGTGTSKITFDGNTLSVPAITVDASTGAINGIGTGNSQSVANNTDSVIRAPGGGVFTTQASVVTGAIKIRLPQSWTDTMMRFTVEVYEYSAGYMCTVEIGGYNYSGPYWYNVSARVIGGSNVEYPVYFGHDGTKCCIWIGAYNETWSYPQVRVRDFFAGYNNVSRDLWATGWQVSFDTTNITSGTGTNQFSASVLDTFPGADWSKTARRPTNLANLSGTEAILNSGISIGSNGALSGAGGGQVTIGGLGYTGELNATYGAVAGSNFRDSNGRTIGDDKLLGNLLDVSKWVPDSNGSQPGFSQNGVSTGGLNYIAYDTLPSGVKGVHWRARSGSAAGTGPEGGWNGDLFKIDYSKMYRFTVWIRCFGANASGSFYLGPGGSTVQDIGGGTNSNPYFLSTDRNQLPDSQWVLVVGYVFPANYSGSQEYRGGVYRASDGVKIINGTDYRWVPGQTTSLHRAYQYYTTQANNYQDFYDPRVEIMDGSEPSLDQLLAGGKAYAASLTAAWTGVSNRPSNLSSLSGTEAIRNTDIGISSSGGTISLTGAGSSTVTGVVLPSNPITPSNVNTYLANNAVITSKLFVTGRGKALNDDPQCQDISAWINPQNNIQIISTVGDTGVTSGSTAIRATNQAQVYSRAFAVQPGKTYKVSCLLKQTAGPGIAYIRLYCYDTTGGTLVSYNLYNMSGSLGAFEGITVPGSWTRYTGYMSPGSGAVYAYLFLHVNWSSGNSSSITDMTDLRVEEYIGADLIVDGAVTAQKINITDPNTTGRVAISTNKVQVYDNSNQLRVTIGYLL